MVKALEMIEFAVFDPSTEAYDAKFRSGFYLRPSAHTERILALHSVIDGRDYAYWTCPDGDVHEHDLKECVLLFERLFERMMADEVDTP